MGLSNHKQRPNGVVDEHSGRKEEHTEAGYLCKLLARGISYGSPYEFESEASGREGATQGTGGCRIACEETSEHTMAGV